MVKAPSPPAKQPLALYNIWPRNYASSTDGKTAFEAMTADIPRIAKMGFNSVYVNPFYETGRMVKSDGGKIGSLYASYDMSRTNPILFGGKAEKFIEKDGSITAQGKQVKTFCEEIKKEGMQPLFDLVQSHLSLDSPLVREANDQGIKIMRHHSNGNFAIHEMDENYNPQREPQHVWDDIVKFNFEDPEAKKFITDRILIPYVEEMATLGFRGIRMDSTPQTPNDVHVTVTQAFKRKIAELEGKNIDEIDPILLAETLDPKHPTADEVKGAASHCYSSGYFYPGKQNLDDNPHDNQRDFEKLYNPFTLNAVDNWLKGRISSKQQSMNGGAIIPVSTHDVERAATFIEDLFSEELKDKTPQQKQEAISRLVRIKMAFSALFSGGGYMMTSGDEFLLTERPNVFHGRLVPADSFEIEEGYSLNATQIAEIKKIAKQSDKPVNYDVNGKTFQFELQADTYTRPIAEWGEQPPVPETALICLTQQVQIPELLRKKKLQSNNGQIHKNDRDLSEFLTQLNEVVNQRAPVNPAYYADMYFSTKDKDLLCIVGRVSQDSTQDITVIDVSGRPRNIDLTDEQIDEFCQQSQIGKDFFKEKLQIVGDFPEKRKQQSASLAG